jgi:3-vinyl bacteriochlorophyllide hydratase
MFTRDVVDRFIASVDLCPWDTLAGRWAVVPVSAPGQRRSPLYTPDERRRRDSSIWTIVQGVLAPIQFAAFLISACLVLRYLSTGDGETAATASIVVKTLLLYTIMVTGAIWEREVFGRYLFAPAFFWEDMFSMLVLALHTAYLLALSSDWLTVDERMYLALAAYASYVVNATQFIMKLRAARLDGNRQAASGRQGASGRGGFAGSAE